jgi:hypothetical protein
MATARRKDIWSDDSGAVILEMTVTITLFLTVLFGTVEGGNLFYQWNVATKATQLGARIAAVSVPVSNRLASMTGLDDCDGGATYQPGDPITSNCFDITCVSSSATAATGTCNGSATDYNADAMRSIVFGRNANSIVPDTSCEPANASNPRTLGMCHVFTRITPQKVSIRYQYTGLGYAGRPGGLVPTITVSLKDIDFDWVAMSSLVPGVGPITIPGLRTTITGEDLNQGM